jgi:hypothetical protein
MSIYSGHIGKLSLIVRTQPENSGISIRWVKNALRRCLARLYYFIRRGYRLRIFKNGIISAKTRQGTRKMPELRGYLQHQ